MPARPSRPSTPHRIRSGAASHAVLASVAFGATLFSGEGAGAQTTPQTLPPVSVQGERPVGEYQTEKASSPKYTEPLRDTPQTINVVPNAVIEERGATSLRDALRNVPGITISAGEGGVPLGDNLTIRGYTARTDIFLDGVRDLGNYFRDSFNVEQVEVIKGPASTYFGRGSTGGSVNVVSKMPELGQFIAGGATFGTDMTKRATADINQPLSGLGLANAAFRLNLMVHDSEIAGRDDVLEKQRWGFAPSVAFGLGTPTVGTISYYHLNQDNVPDYGHPFIAGRPAAVSREAFYGLKNRDYEETSTDVVTGKLEHQISQALSVRSVVRYGRTTSDYVASQPTAANLAADTVSRNSKSRDSVDTILLNQTDVTSKFSTGPLGHTLVAGVELARETTENTVRQNNVPGPVTSLRNPDPLQAGPGVPYTGAKTDGTAHSVALYAMDTIKINEQFSASGGLRWDRIDLDVDSRATNGALTAFDRVDSDVSWRAGVTYKPVRFGTVYFAYGTSFNPSGERLALNANTEVVDPETNRSFEIGTKWDLLGERLSITGAVFRIEKTNARTNDPLGGTVQVLDGKQRVDGFEIGVAGNITDNWRAYGGYTYLDGEVIESNNPAQLGTEPVNVAKHSFNLWTTYALPANFEIGGGVQYLSARWAGSAEGSFAGTNTNRVPGYWLFDAMLAYHLTDNIDLRINGYNLTDEFYYEGVYSSMVVPGPGRAVLFTTAFKL